MEEESDHDDCNDLSEDERGMCLQSLSISLDKKIQEESSKYSLREPLPGWPNAVQPISMPTDIKRGDHIVFRVTEPPFRAKFRSALIVEPGEHLKLIMNCEEGVVKRIVPFHLLNDTHIISYVSPMYDENKAIERAEFRLNQGEQCYHVLNNNSHFFVTWCITGRENSLSDILRTLEAESTSNNKKMKLKPIFFQTPIPVINDQTVHPGDHIKCNSQHFLVESVNKARNSCSAFTLNSDNKVTRAAKVSTSSDSSIVLIESELYKHDIPQSLVLKHAFKALEEEQNKWESSDHFVTAMKCGKEYSLDESQSFIIDEKVDYQFIPLTENLTISEGDHLIIRDYQNPDVHHSVLVYSCRDHTRVKVLPEFSSSFMIDLTLYPEVYRVDYSDTLPKEEVLLRGKSRQELMVKSNPADVSCHVAWAKTGKMRQVDLPADVLSNRSYKKIMEYGQIKVGSHLLHHIAGEPAIQRHLIVTEHISQSSYKVIFCSKGIINEREEELKGELYHIIYPSDQELTVDETVALARTQIGLEKHHPWDRMSFAVHAKLRDNNSLTNWSSNEALNPAAECSNCKQESNDTSLLPVSKSRIMCFAQVSCGDYIVQVPSNPLKMNTHYIIKQVVPGYYPTQCTVISCRHGKVKSSECTIEENTGGMDNPTNTYYRINYAPGKCVPPHVSIKKANEMDGHSLKMYNDRFVHFLKTGEQMTVDLKSLPDERDFLEHRKLRSGPFIGQPLYSLPVAIPDQIRTGNHIIYRQGNAFPPSYSSAIVQVITEDDQGNVTFEIITNTHSTGITKLSVKFNELNNLNKVIYLSNDFSEEDAIVRAQTLLPNGVNFYHPDFWNSHHFTTMCMSGREYSLADIIVEIQALYHEKRRDTINCDSDELKLNPVLFKVPIKDLSNIHRADHIMIGKHHYLIESADAIEGKFTAYTVEFPKVKVGIKTGSVILKENQEWITSKDVFKIEYCLHEGRVYEASEVIQRAKTEHLVGSKWKNCAGFLTKMKCGKEYVFDDQCLMSNDVKIDSYTRVTPHISISEGDHLVVCDSKQTSKYKSVLVWKCFDKTTVEITPSLSYTSTVSEPVIDHEEIQLTEYVIYRVNYSQSLPSDEVLKRAESKLGKEILTRSTERFASWAKTGREMCIESDTEFEKQVRIAEKRPVRYEKLRSSDEIKIGDHLFTKWTVDYVLNDYQIKRNHYFVTERLMNTVNPIYKVMQLSMNGELTEIEQEFNPTIETGSEVYRVEYPEEFSTELSMKRARSLLKKKFKLTFASTLMRWIKTGSQERLEFDFLINSCAPLSRSPIACFTQLNPGDYLLKQGSRFVLGKLVTYSHHYIVVSVESPMQCTVIESWRRKVEKKHLCCDDWSKESSYYRINYDPGQCIPPEHSIELAHKAISDSRYLKPNSECARQSFVHFFKTGEKEVKIDHFQDDRHFLQRELITSALDLCVGDHIERPLSLAPEHAQHHMIVVEPISHTTCKVIHFRVEKSFNKVVKFQKGDVVTEDVDIFAHGDVLRIVYTERTDPKDGMKKLTRICEQGKKQLQLAIGKLEYNLKDNNCEHLVMLATVGIPLSIQVNQVIHHALIFARGTLRSARGSLIHHGAECAPKETTAHLMGQAWGKQASGRITDTGLKSATSISSLAMAGGIAFAINLAVETPVYVRSIYKLNRKAKFDVISEKDYKRSVVSETLRSSFIVTGGTVGTVAGQATIPVPLLGAMVGGLLGGVIGHGLAAAASGVLKHAMKEKKITLPKLVSYKYQKLLEY